MFVGGLSYEVDNQLLKDSFAAFGSLKKALVIREQRTGQSKGYGFVTFTSRQDLSAALRTPVYILGRLADCHPVLTKGMLKDQEQRDVAAKIFVGGVSQSATADDLFRHFSQFGQITEARILYDGKTGKSRGFGFVLFQSPEEVEAVLAAGPHKLKKKLVEVKRFSKEKETEFGNLQGTHTSQISSNEDDREPQSTQASSKNKRKSKNQRKKAQKLKQNSMESLSTISEKESPKADHTDEGDYFTPKICSSSHQQVYEYEHSYQQVDSSSQNSGSKPNFTLSGFFSNSQSVDPLHYSLPVFRGNSFVPSPKPTKGEGSSWYCQSKFSGLSWTPGFEMFSYQNQSRPVPDNSYNY